MQEHTQKKFKHKVKNMLEQWVVHHSLIDNTPFFDPEQFSWTLELEQNWEIVCQELDQILNTQNVPSAQTLLPTSGIKKLSAQWKIYALYGYGIKVEENCQECPQTTRLIEKMPGMKTAFFSVLPPGTHLQEHRGPYNGVIRCLLGLKIPKAKEMCGFRIGEEIRHWETGKCMLFDDTFRHEAWNNSDEIRVCLFLDVVRPLKFPMSVLNNLLLKTITLSLYIRGRVLNL